MCLHHPNQEYGSYNGIHSINLVGNAVASTPTLTLPLPKHQNMQGKNADKGRILNGLGNISCCTWLIADWFDSHS